MKLIFAKYLVHFLQASFLHHLIPIDNIHLIYVFQPNRVEISGKHICQASQLSRFQIRLLIYKKEAWESLVTRPTS